MQYLHIHLRVCSGFSTHWPSKDSHSQPETAQNHGKDERPLQVIKPSLLTQSRNATHIRQSGHSWFYLTKYQRIPNFPWATCCTTTLLAEVIPNAKTELPRLKVLSSTSLCCLKASLRKNRQVTVSTSMIRGISQILLERAENLCFKKRIRKKKKAIGQSKVIEEIREKQ